MRFPHLKSDLVVHHKNEPFTPCGDPAPVFRKYIHIFAVNEIGKLDMRSIKLCWKAAIILIILATLVIDVRAQGYDYYGEGIKLKFGEDSAKYIRFITWHQIWTRMSEHNAGSTRLGQDAPTSFDFGVRRSRFMAYAQVTDRFLVLTHFGINNQTALSGGMNGRDGQRAPFFMHDAWADFKLFKDYLHVGAGLHYWNGLSRMTRASTLNFLALDAPIFNWPTIDQTDQFARRIGVFAKGRAGKLVYNFSLSDPFRTNLDGAIAVDQANFSPRNNAKVLDGYVSYEFFEPEGNLLPFTVGTYLGDKKIFNLGAGFMHNTDAMWYQTTVSGGGADTAYASMTLLSVDAFLDIPLTQRMRGGSITFYTVAYFYDMGPNNVRFIGIMNPADGGGPARGNAVPTIGTGRIHYWQLGFALPRKSDKYVVQPYVAMSHAYLEGLQNEDGDEVPVHVFDTGVNLLLAGHHAKLTLSYRNRPDFTDVQALERRSELVLQTMIYF